MVDQLGRTHEFDLVEGSHETMFHKIINNNIAINVPDYISKSTLSLRGQHWQAYIIPQNNVEAYQFSFFPRTIRCWNQLPISVTEVPSQETFQNRMWKAIASGEIEVCRPRESQTQIGQLQSAAASPGVLRGDTGEMTCTVYRLHNCF